MTDPVSILHDGGDEYEDKNDDYGDSWRMVGKFLYELSGGEGVTLETKEDFISFGLFTRRLDKFARAFNGEFLQDEMNFEAVKDSHEDEMVYAAMAASNQSERKSDDDSDVVGVLKANDESIAERLKNYRPATNHLTTVPENYKEQ